MKPTDIWTNSTQWIPRPMCKNGDGCHEAAPRGSKTGTQGLRGDYERSKIPDLLCHEILQSCIEPMRAKTHFSKLFLKIFFGCNGCKC